MRVARFDFVLPEIADPGFPFGLFLGTFLMFTPAAAEAQAPVTATAAVDRQTIRIGEVLELQVEVSYAQDFAVQLPGAEVDLGPFELRDYRVEPPEPAAGGGLSTRAVYQLSVFETGELEIPPLEVSYSARSGTQGSVKTQKLVVNVESVLTDAEADIRDIKPPMEIPRDWLPLLLAAGVGALAAGTGFYLWRRRRRKTESGDLPAAAPGRPPDEVALEALERLRRSDLLNRGEIEPYHVEVSDILRRYLEGRYRIDALEMTSAETLQSLRQQRLPGEPYRLCESVLAQCDLVKFAKFLPTRSLSEKALDLGVEIVNKTRAQRSDSSLTSGVPGQPRDPSSGLRPVPSVYRVGAPAVPQEDSD